MIKVGFIGWRGMVGSVLIKRMIEELDLVTSNHIFFLPLKVAKKILNGILVLKIKP